MSSEWPQEPLRHQLDWITLSLDSFSLICFVFLLSWCLLTFGWKSWWLLLWWWRSQGNAIESKLEYSLLIDHIHDTDRHWHRQAVKSKTRRSQVNRLNWMIAASTALFLLLSLVVLFSLCSSSSSSSCWYSFNCRDDIRHAGSRLRFPTKERKKERIMERKEKGQTRKLTGSSG